MKLAIILLLTSFAHAKIACSVRAYDDSKKELHISCPPDDVYSPLRIDLYLNGEVASPHQGSLCFWDSDKGDMSLEYKDDKGKKRWTRFDTKSMRMTITETEVH